MKNAVQDGLAVNGWEESLPPAPDARDNTEYRRLLEKLAQASLHKRYDAYLDIDWDNPELAVSDTDSRWELSSHDALGGSEWYRNLPQKQRIALALERTAIRVKTGILFESILVRGMLEFAINLPNGTPEFRYAMHECIEECQHSLMFQEFVNRIGTDPGGLTPGLRLLARYIIKQGQTCPALFFLFVLGGEGPIDHDQREQLRLQKNLHPLMRRIDQIHITEEARHICFANAYLREYVPKMGWGERWKLRLLAPLILGNMGAMFLHPPQALVARYKIPQTVLDACYRNNPQRKRELQEAMQSLCDLCRELGILHPRTAFLWRKYNLIP